MREPDEVRLARIEEGMVRIHDRISSNHSEVMTALRPVMAEMPKHQDAITEIKRDRFWLFSLATVAFGMGGGALGLAGYALVDHFFK